MGKTNRFFPTRCSLSFQIKENQKSKTNHRLSSAFPASFLATSSSCSAFFPKGFSVNKGSDRSDAEGVCGGVLLDGR
ncbi:unnamed protein product [Lactuca virosa]|uniref:Uncharacterized protein n=1 Tax=Lactuca virosa TaxID=75947 RepID=A0AAU9LTG1_9ASTR|nr:unnamed protein product [Lactuca virosa]